MGVRNFLVEGVSGTGKTSVCSELVRRGEHAVHGDRELAYQGDPATGAPTDVPGHEHHLWNVERVRALVADRSALTTYFCGGFRNHRDVLDLFDGVFVLEVDAETLRRRLLARPRDEYGGRTPEREFVLGLHATCPDVPTGPGVIRIDATAPLSRVVDEILRRSAPIGSSAPDR